jgi:hypothetical protein
MLFIACASDEVNLEPTNIHPGEVHYILDWTTESRALIQVDGYAKFINDLGFDVTLEEAYLTTSRMEIVSCATNRREARGFVPFIRELWASIWRVSEAHAGHSSLPDNAAALEHSVVEDLLMMDELLVGTRSLVDEPYCQAHFLTAKASNTTEALPDALDMTDRTLYVRGQAFAPGSGELIEFEGSTSLGNGVLSSLAYEDSETFVHQGLDGSLEIIVLRDLRTIFDGIDFSSAGSNAIGWRALDNLLFHTQIVGHPLP